ncbi:uncharacterized protein [Euwallacea similis]|uniref:uncharacterized protein n=1 Tax=Euwallacea similis TaxID=1736056 RepID=UPI0034500F42
MLRDCGVQIFVAVLCVMQISCEDEIRTSFDRSPVYKYRYETEDMMKTSATSVPVRGYHVVEGGYYPAESGLVGAAVAPVGIGIAPGGIGGVGPVGFGVGGGIGGIGGGYGGIGLDGGVGQIGVGGIGYGGHIAPHFIGAGPGIGAVGLGGGGYIAPIVHGYGGEEVAKNEFSEGKKNVEDAKYEKAHGKKGEETSHGKEGYSQGSEAVKDVKGEEGYYSDKAGAKNVVEDGKQYQGGQSFNQDGKNGAEHSIKKGHKKGHVIKGFKSSHHKDETGKTEEYYDEEHDEADNYAFNGQNGQFGQKGASSYKGGHEDGKFNEQEHKKAGHVSNELAVKKEAADQGKYGEKKYAGGESSYGVNSGADQQSLLGHQENARFVKHHPVPFYHHY